MMRCARRHDRHVIAAEPAAVRDLLLLLEHGPALAGLSVEERECTLLVLAEAMNNVVEHGYRNGAAEGFAPEVGWIGLVPGPWRSGRDWRIVDRAQGPPPAACLRADMPEEQAEGGFGWPLIMALTEKVRLRRCGGFNILTVQVRAEGATATVGHGDDGGKGGARSAVTPLVGYVSLPPGA